MNIRLQWASCFLLGVFGLSFLPSLPALPWWCLLLLGLMLCRWRTARWFAIMLLGFSWAGFQASDRLNTRLPAAYEGVDVLLEGRIASLPTHTARSTRFVFKVDQVLEPGHQLALPIRRIRLNWYHAPQEVRTGERWQLKVRLKQPHGFSNPNGFDYEAWLFQHRIDGLGYVRSSTDNANIAEPGLFHINVWRAKLSYQFDQLIPERQHQAVLRALAMGDRSQMTEAQWQVLRQTGTSHLMAISGLHIGLVSGLVFALVRGILVFVGVAHVSPQRTAAAMAMLAAFGYAALSGFAIPAQRALVMVLVVLGALYTQRHLQSSSVFATALFGVLLLDPLAVMSAGFWLSFAAVAVLLFGMSGYLGRWSTVKSLIYAQGLIVLGLGPLVLLFFHQWPLVSPLANVLAVPWVSFVVVPLVLLGVVLSAASEILGNACWLMADHALTIIWWVLQQMSNWPYSQWQTGPISFLAFTLAALGAILLLAPRGVPGRGLSLLLFLPIYFPPQDSLKAETFRLTMLDVGQGLSAVVETQHHVLVFDTGARWSERFDLAKSVITPYLMGQGYRRIDRLLVSHGDNDHAGGVQTLRSQFELGETLTSVPQRFEGVDASACVAGQYWQWDGVQFEVLHPSSDTLFSGNDASCVLRVQSKWGSALLTGDIERPAERVLLSEHAERLAVDVLMAPHHGSKSSSTAAFVQAVSPSYVWFPVGYRNRFGFPHVSVVQRYQEFGGKTFDTAQHGALSMVFDEDANLTMQTHRQKSMRYWHWRPGASPAQP